MKSIVFFAIGFFLICVRLVLAAPFEERTAPPAIPAGPSQSLADLREESLASPYFIDELHCDGLFISQTKRGWNVSMEDLKAVRRLEEKEACEKLFRTFRVEKYSWISLSDLEKVSTQIKQSNFFEESNLTLKKSELKNHVHLFLKTKTKPRYLYQVNSDFKVYQINLPRIYEKFGGEMVDRAYEPNDLQIFGFTAEGSFAGSSSLSVASNINTNDQRKLNSKNYYLTDIYSKTKNQLSQSFALNYGIHLLTDNISTDQFARLNLQGDIDFLYTSSSFYVGPTMTLGTSSDYNDDGSKVLFFGNSYVFLPGVTAGYTYGNLNDNFLKTFMSYYHSFIDNHILFEVGLSGQCQLSSHGYFLEWQAKYRSVTNAILRHDLYPLTDPRTFSDRIGFYKAFFSGKSKHHLGIGIGTESLGSANPSYDYLGSSNGISINYKLFSDQLNLNLGLAYYFNRVY